MDREGIQKENPGFILTGPLPLLKEWGGCYRFNRNEIHEFQVNASIAEIESRLAVDCSKRRQSYALTGLSGAARWISSIKHSVAAAYVDADIDQLANDLPLTKGFGRGNLLLLTPYDPGVFYGSREIEGARVASPIQIYLDLLHVPDGGVEASQTLLDQVLRPAWKDPGGGRDRIPKK